MTDRAEQLDAAGQLPAGRICLEFANTADWHASDAPVERLGSYQDLVTWAEAIGILSCAEAADLRARAGANPRLAAQVHAWAVELREALYWVFTAVATAAPPAQPDLDLLNEALPRAFLSPALVWQDGRFSWEYRSAGGLDSLLWPVLRSAATLLTSPDLDRVGQCADERGCGYLFFDTSRNRSRRWCDMSSCGNRAKAKRHYSRQRSGPKRPTGSDSPLASSLT